MEYATAPKLLIVFLDGVHPRYLDMPAGARLRALVPPESVAEVEPVLGFSNAIKTTLFSGVPPDVHDQWSKFRLGPNDSQFAHARRFRWIDRVPTDLARKGLKFGLSKTYVRRLGAAVGHPSLSWENVPLRLLPHFVHTERDPLREDGTPSFFRVAEGRGLRVSWTSVPTVAPRAALDQLPARLAASDVAVVYNAGMDLAGHLAGPDGSAWFARGLERTGRIAARAGQAAKDAWGPGFRTVLVSDHGMAPTRLHIDVLRKLERLPGAGTGFLYFIDATMARFWYFDDTARSRVHALMDQVGHGHFLSAGEKRRFGVNFAHNGYGDEVFLLDPDTAFYPAFVSWARPKGMHGYDPTHATQAAVFGTDGPVAPAKRMPITQVYPRLVGLVSAA